MDVLQSVDDSQEPKLREHLLPVRLHSLVARQGVDRGVVLTGQVVGEDAFPYSEKYRCHLEKVEPDRAFFTRAEFSFTEFGVWNSIPALDEPQAVLSPIVCVVSLPDIQTPR